MKKSFFLIFIVLMATTAYCEDAAIDWKKRAGFSDTLIGAYEEGYRSSGIIPYRKDSPALHFEPAEKGITLLPNGEFNSAAIGGFSFIRKAPQLIPEGAHLLVRSGFGFFDTSQALTLVSLGAKKFSVMGGYGYRRADVAEIGAGGLKSDVYPLNSTARYRTDTRDGLAYESQAGYLRLNTAPFERLLVDISWLRTDAENIRYSMLKLDSVYDTNNEVEATANFKKPMPGINEIVIAVYWRGYGALYDDRLRESARLPNGMLREFSMQNYGELYRHGARASAAIPLYAGEVAVGADYAIMNVDAVNRSNNGTVLTERSLIPDVDISFTAAYLNWRSDPNKSIRLSSGMRIDSVSADAQKAPATAASHKTEPSGWLKGSWQSADGFDLSLSFGSTVKFPNAQELYMGITTPSPQLGSPLLAPARSYRPELSLDYHKDLFELHGYLFWSRIADFVTIYQLNSTTKSFRNVDAELWGAGSSAGLKLPANMSLKLTLNYSQGDDLSWSRPLPETPPLTGTATIRYDNSRTFVSLTERFSSRQRRTDITLGEQPNPSWAVTDIKAGYRFKWLTLTTGVDNVADASYSTNLLHLRDPLATGVRVPEAGRFFWGMAEILL